VVKAHQYSQAKFTSFDADKQFKAIVQLLAELEQNLHDSAFRSELIISIDNCLNWGCAEVKERLPLLTELKLESTSHEIVRIITQSLRDYKPAYNDKDIEIYRFDGMGREPLQGVPYPLTVIVDNLRSGYNLGSIFRTAECVQAAWIYLCGITPIPPFRQMLKSAMGTEERVKYTLATTENAIAWCKEKGLPVVALETVANAKSLFDYQPTQPVAVIVGNEALGISEDILKLADEVLYIPVYGWKNSLNVSNAFTLAAYKLTGIIQ
jgi:23S rRNA (guanosine2251-2'-O)-methyltransferase